MQNRDDDAASLAETVALLEQRTRQLYAGWSQALRQSGNGDTAALLDRFASEAETARADCLARMQGADAATGAAVFGSTPVRLVPDPTIDDLDPQIASSYQILAAAVRNEERAFRALSHVAAIAEEAAPRGLAEAMASLQLSRAARLRRHRRNAYRRAQVESGSTADLPPASLVQTEADLIHAANFIESEAVDTLGKIASLQPDLVTQLAQSENAVERLQDKAQRVGPPSQAVAEAFQDYADLPAGGEATPAGLRAMAITGSKRAFGFYDAVVANANDEALMLLAQELSEDALARLRAVQPGPDWD